MAEDASPPTIADEPALNKLGIDAAVMAQYLDSVGAKSQCEVCQASSWTVTANVGSATPVINAQDLTRLGDMMGMPVVMLSCNNCGNTKFFGRDFITNWLAKRAEGQ